MEDRSYKNQWTSRKGLAALLMAAIACAATFDAWADIFHIAWFDEESSHIYLVPPVLAWLIWVRRSRLRYCRVQPSYVGSVIIAVGWLVSAWGYRHSAQALWHGGAVLAAVGGVVAVLGRDLVQRLLPAFVVLVFLVPVPARIHHPLATRLMPVTAEATQKVSELLGVPAECDGNQLSINGHQVAVVEACNGLRLVFALVLVSYAFAFGEPLRNYVRMLILAASPVCAIICNVIRLVPTLWIYGYGPSAIADPFHNVAGWVMLVIAFLLLMGIIRLLRWAMVPVNHYMLAGSEY